MSQLMKYVLDKKNLVSFDCHILVCLQSHCLLYLSLLPQLPNTELCI